MKILVLNNDPKDRLVIEHVLEQGGHEIVIAENSQAAIQILKEGEVRFVIADRVTTDMDEKQFLKNVRDAKPPYYIYILLLTSTVQESDITTPRSGADDYLQKPVIAVELKSRIFVGGTDPWHGRGSHESKGYAREGGVVRFPDKGFELQSLSLLFGRRAGTCTPWTVSAEPDRIGYR